MNALTLTTRPARLASVRRMVLCASAAAVLAAASDRASAQCALAFAPPSMSVGPAHTATSRMAVGDLNGDQITDVAYLSGENIAVMFGTGAYSFEEAILIPAGNATTSVLIADVNGDELPDLVAIRVTGFGLGIFLNGAGGTPGTFGAPQNLGTGGVSLQATTADANGDGFTDIVIAQYNSVRIMYGSADGFVAGSVSYSASDATLQAAIADLNGDGLKEVISITTSSMRIYLGQVPGSIPIHVDYPIGPGAKAFALADLNDDGRDDIVAAADGGTSLQVYFGASNAALVSPPQALGVRGHPTDVKIADVNQDGRLDLISTSPAEGVVNVLRGTGANTFATFQSFSAGANAIMVAAGRAMLPSPVDADLFVLNENPTVTVSVLANMSAYPAVMTQPQPVTVASGATASFTAMARMGSNDVAYQWRRNGVPIAGDARFLGSQTPTLLISPTLAQDSGSAFDCVMTTACGSVTSFPAGLLVTPACPADFNQDDSVDPDDLGDFINVFFSGSSDCQ